MTQLQLIEGAAPSRPTRSDERVINAAVDAMMPSVIQYLVDGGGWDETEAERESLREQLQENFESCVGDDGLEICRHLGRRYGWDWDRAAIDLFDDVYMHIQEASDAVVAQWIKDWDIKPRHAVGKVLKFLHDGTEVEGLITHVSLKRASYTLNCPSLGHVPPGKTGTVGICLDYEDLDAAEVK